LQVTENPGQGFPQRTNPFGTPDGRKPKMNSHKLKLEMATMKEKSPCVAELFKVLGVSKRPFAGSQNWRSPRRSRPLVTHRLPFQDLEPTVCRTAQRAQR